MFKRLSKTISLTIIAILFIGLMTTVTAVDWAEVKETGNWTEVEKSVIPFNEAEIESYQQSPFFDSKVAEGELPEVKERLPEEPLVVKPTDEIGQYGGTFTLAGPRPHFAAVHHTLMDTAIKLNRYDPMNETFANIIKNWEFSNSGKVLTLHLREGMKWSDGHPFTAEAFRFYYEDVAFNEEINPVTSTVLKPIEEVEVVDDYTFRYHFDKPYYAFAEGNLAAFSGQQGNAFLPAHYLKKYHKDYNEDADELAEEEGYERWVELFGHYAQQGAFIPEEVPTVGPWVKANDTGDAIIFERNPYYWKVDPAGNQLPYMDKMIVKPWKQMETFVTMIISGDVDWAGWSTPLSEYPTIKSNEDQGNYDVWLGKQPKGNDSTFFLNQTPQDEELGKVFRKKKFRHALSLAIDREEINEVVFLGQGEPRQAAYNPATPGVTEDWSKAYIDYEPERAKNLLDEIDIVDKDNDGWRERYDGETLSLNIIVTEDYPFNVSTTELVKDYWQDIGIKADMKVISRSLFNERSEAGRYDATVWFIDNVGPNKVPITRGAWFTWQGWNLAGPDWGLWLNTDGEDEDAVEPPQVVKDVYEKGGQLPYVNAEKRTELLEEISEINAEQLWIIGTVFNTGSVTMADRNLGNVRRGMGTWTGDGVSTGGTGGINWFYQYYWKTAEDRK